MNNRTETTLQGRMVWSAFGTFCSVCALSEMKSKIENVARLGALWMWLSRILLLTLCFALLFSSTLDLVILLLQATALCGAGCILWHSALLLGINRNPCIWTTCSHEMFVLILLLLIIQCEISVPCRDCHVIIANFNYSSLVQVICGNNVWQQLWIYSKMP